METCKQGRGFGVKSRKFEKIADFLDFGWCPPHYSPPLYSTPSKNKKAIWLSSGEHLCEAECSPSRRLDGFPAKTARYCADFTFN